MLTLQDISLSFSERQIFDKLSLSLNDGEKVALVGPNGAGKTSLLRIILGEILPDSGTIILPSGASKVGYIPQHLKLKPEEENLDVLSFMLEGRQLHSINSRLTTLEEKIAHNPLGKNINGLLSEQHQLFEAYHDAEGYKAEDDILNLIVGIGLDIDFGQKIRTLSGGQKTKLALARLLYERSDILLLDEPTNHIETDAIIWLANYLRNSPKTVFVVSHSPEFLNCFIGKVVYLSGQGTAKVYHGNYNHFLKVKSKDDLRDKRSQQKLRGELDRQQAIVGHTIQRQSGLKHAREKIVGKLEEEVKATKKQRKTLRLNFPVRNRLHSHALIVDQISKSFGQKRLFNRLSFLVDAKDRFGVIGVNGTGKTTFLRILAHDLNPDQGAVHQNQHLEIGWYRQEQEDLRDDHTILEEVENSTLSPEYLRSTLAHFLFPANMIGQLVGNLSRGERTRLALCKIMLSKPNLLLLDEPTNHLDIEAKESLKLALSRYEGAVVLVSHDQDFLSSIGITWALKFPEGRLISIQKKEA